MRPVSSTDCPFVSSCSPRPVARTQLLSTRGGKHRHRGTSTLPTRSFSSARARRLAAAFGNRDRVSRTPRRFAFHTARAMHRQVLERGAPAPLSWLPGGAGGLSMRQDRQNSLQDLPAPLVIFTKHETISEKSLTCSPINETNH